MRAQAIGNGALHGQLIRWGCGGRNYVGITSASGPIAHLSGVVTFFAPLYFIDLSLILTRGGGLRTFMIVWPVIKCDDWGSEVAILPTSPVPYWCASGKLPTNTPLLLEYIRNLEAR